MKLSQPVPSPYQITLSCPLFWVGAVLFYLNEKTDADFNVPIAEIVLFGMMGLGFLVSGTVLRQTAGLLALLLGVALSMWAGMAEILHDNGTAVMARTIFKFIIFYGLFAGYTLLPEKRHILTVACGFLCSYIFNAVFDGVHNLLDDSQANNMIKYLLPNPATTFLAGWFLGHYHSKPIRRFLLIGTFLVIALSFPSGARTTMLTLPLGLGFYYMVRYIKMPNWVWVSAALIFPLTPVIPVMIAYEPDNIVQLGQWFFERGIATLSNVERTLMIHASITVILDSPITGASLREFISHFGPTYIWLMEQRKVAAESPHQYYLELAVPYGIPAMLTAIAIFFLVIRLAVRSCKAQKIDPAVAAFVFGGLSLLLMSGPISSMRRFDIMIAIFYITAGLRQGTQHANENHDDPPPQAP